MDLWFWAGIADLAFSIPYLVVEVMGMDKLPVREKWTYFLVNHFALERSQVEGKEKSAST